MADSTGGLALFDASGEHLEDSLTKIVADLRARYSIGYRAQAPASGGVEVRKLSVEARDANGRRLEVRSRREYRIGEETK
jgi:hypothetical protein